tara:strand:- start:1175 stop:1522 length:348 start_codon:yes stop_codon:yes gene_type:complete
MTNKDYNPNDQNWLSPFGFTKKSVPDATDLKYCYKCLRNNPNDDLLKYRINLFSIVKVIAVILLIIYSIKLSITCDASVDAMRFIIAVVLFPFHIIYTLVLKPDRCLHLIPSIFH